MWLTHTDGSSSRKRSVLIGNEFLHRMEHLGSKGVLSLVHIILQPTLRWVVMCADNVCGGVGGSAAVFGSLLLTASGTEGGAVGVSEGRFILMYLQ